MTEPDQDPLETLRAYILSLSAKEQVRWESNGREPTAYEAMEQSKRLRKWEDWSRALETPGLVPLSAAQRTIQLSKLRVHLTTQFRRLSSPSFAGVTREKLEMWQKWIEIVDALIRS